MIKKCLSFCILISSLILQAQVQLVITSLPANTPADTKIFVAGSFNGWNPAETALHKNAEGNFIVTVPESDGKAEYKFTRGSWDKR